MSKKVPTLIVMVASIGLVLSACSADQTPSKSAAGQNDDWWQIRGSCDASAIAPVSNSNDFVFAVDENDTLRRWIAPDTYPPAGGEDAGQVEEWLDLTKAVKSTGGIDGNMPLDKKKPEMDLEGAAQIGDQVFWIGSNGLNKSGKYRPNRMIFLATNVPTAGSDGALSGTPRDLFPALIRANAKGKVSERQPWLSASDFAAWEAIPRLFGVAPAGWTTQPAKDRFSLSNKIVGVPPKSGGFNIEGLAADGNELLIGLRSPVTNGRAWILRLANPAEIVADPTAAPQISIDDRPDLGDNRGIRAMTESNGDYWLVGGPIDAVGEANGLGPTFALFDWIRNKSHFPTESPYTFPTGTRPEGIAMQGTNLLVVSDDGAVARDENGTPKPSGDVLSTECKEETEDKMFFRATSVPATKLTPSG
jgi:hypothetical protein